MRLVWLIQYIHAAAILFWVRQKKFWLQKLGQYTLQVLVTVNMPNTVATKLCFNNITLQSLWCKLVDNVQVWMRILALRYQIFKALFYYLLYIQKYQRLISRQSEALSEAFSNNSKMQPELHVDQFWRSFIWWFSCDVASPQKSP